MYQIERKGIIWVCVVGVLLFSGCIPATETILIAGQSMYPSFTVGDKVQVNRQAYQQQDPERGDIVMVSIPVEEGGPVIIRRVVGLPGEFVEIRDGLVWINGERLDEPYLTVLFDSELAREWALDADEYIIFGDIGLASRDSRFLGPVTRESIVGKVITQP